MRESYRFFLLLRLLGRLFIAGQIKFIQNFGSRYRNRRGSGSRSGSGNRSRSRFWLRFWFGSRNRRKNRSCLLDGSRLLLRLHNLHTFSLLLTIYLWHINRDQQTGIIRNTIPSQTLSFHTPLLLLWLHEWECPPLSWRVALADQSPASWPYGWPIPFPYRIRLEYLLFHIVELLRLLEFLKSFLIKVFISFNHILLCDACEQANTSAGAISSERKNPVSLQHKWERMNWYCNCLLKRSLARGKSPWAKARMIIDR